jgi:transcriptional regulator with XRE-family HTH domain
MLLGNQALFLSSQPGGEGLPKVGGYIAPVNEKTIAHRLRELRKRRGKTQVELAATLGIDQTLVSAYERGAVRMHGAIVAAFAKALRTSSDQLLGLEKIEQDGVLRDRRFIRRLEKIDQLPKRRKQALLKSLDMLLKGAGVA